MIFKRAEVGDTGKWIVRAIPIMFIALGIWVTLKLVSEGRYLNATGGIIFAIIMIFILILLFIKPSGNKISDSTPDILYVEASINEEDKFVVLYSSKDIIRITQIEEALRSRDINCIVLDRHGSVMMSFIPDIEMRIMVPREDYKWSVQIVNELLK